MPLTGPTDISLLGQRGGGQKGQVRACRGQREVLGPEETVKLPSGAFQLRVEPTQGKRGRDRDSHRPDPREPQSHLAGEAGHFAGEGLTDLD